MTNAKTLNPIAAASVTEARASHIFFPPFPNFSANAPAHDAVPPVGLNQARRVALWPWRIARDRELGKQRQFFPNAVPGPLFGGTRGIVSG